MARHLPLDPFDDQTAEIGVGDFIQAVKKNKTTAPVKFVFEPAVRGLEIDSSQSA